MYKYAHYKSTTSMIDMFMLLTVGFVTLFVLAFILIKPVVPKTEQIPLEEQLLIKLEWDDTINADLDIWLRNPVGDIVSFKNKDVHGATLERDDLGHSNEWTMINGKPSPIFSNYEVIRIKNLIDGDYFITVHYYSSRGNDGTPLPPSATKPGHSVGEFRSSLPFMVSAYIPNKHKPIFIEDRVVEYHKETPVIKFTVIDGGIIEMSHHTLEIALSNLGKGL